MAAGELPVPADVPEWDCGERWRFATVDVSTSDAMAVAALPMPSPLPERAGCDGVFAIK